MALPAPLIDALSNVLIVDLDRGDWDGLLLRMAATVGALREIRETRDPSIVPTRDAPLVFAAAIDRLGTPNVASAAQAHVWSHSAKPLHRALAQAWTFAHPDESAAFERRLADEQAQAILSGVSLHDRAEDLLPPLAPRTVHFKAFRDEDAGVWTASSDDDIATEADTQEALQVRLSELVPDLLETREGRVGPLTIIIDWQELQTVGQTTFAVDAGIKSRHTANAILKSAGLAKGF